VRPLAPHAAADAVALARAVEAAVNVHRRRLGLSLLSPHPVLTAAAQQHSQRMRNLGFFAHTDPVDHSSAKKRVDAIDRRLWHLLAENLAAGMESADAVVEGWLDSPGHRANLEHPALTHFGTAVATGGPLGTYTTQLYGQEWDGPQIILPSAAELRMRAQAAARRASRRWTELRARYRA
jgi:uncharacterized protein YkwD